MRKQIIRAAILASCAGTTSAFAIDVGPSTTVGGVVFFDLSHISLQNENAAGQKIDTAPTGTGFDVKRFYLIVDHKFNDTWSADLTTDAQYLNATTATVSTPGTPPGTTTAVTNQNTAGVTEVFIKKLYLEGKFDPAFILRIGSYNMPWDAFVEDLYGYRFVEKTTTDRLGFSNTTDWGINASGAAGGNGIFSYSAAVVNGGGFKNPTRTKDVDFEGRIGVKPTDWLTLGAGLYSGHLGQINATNENFPKNNATRIDLTGAVVISGIRVGAEWFQAKNYKTVNNVTTSAFGTSAIVGTATVGPVDDKAEGVSTWASYNVQDQWSVFARYDNTKLSKDIAPNLKDVYFNLGVDYKPLKQLDFALVYKNEKVQNGANSISGADANGSYTIGGANGLRDGHFNEVGVYTQWKF